MKKIFVLFIVCFTLVANTISITQAKPLEPLNMSNVIEDQIVRTDFFDICEAYEISQNELEHMTTMNILDKVLDFPYLGLFLYAYDNVEIGLIAMKEQYSVYKVLSERDDLQLALYSKYNELSEQRENPFISQQMINELDENLLVISILQDQNYSGFSTFAVQEVPFDINYSFAKNTYTPRNSAVALHAAERNLNNTEQSLISEAIETLPYSITMLSLPSSKYNCHSYAWITDNDRTYYWMNDPTKFMTDGSYVLESSPSIGSRVYYQPVNVNGMLFGNHSALVTQSASNVGDFVVQSKWGKWGLYEHKIKDCNYYYNNNYVKFYDTPIRIGIKAFQRYINANLPSQYLGTPLVIDGNFGPASNLAAVKLLQYWLNRTYNAGLTIDGGFGNLTYNACVTLAQGDSGMGVYILQGLLYGNGYNPNGFDGSFGVNGGTGCLNAVKAFQSANGLTVDGRAGKNTFRALCT